MITLIGGNGSMGKRYQAILKYLGEDVACFDKDATRQEIWSQSRNSKAIIIASPTDTHMNYLESFLHFDTPILCEKPISKDLEWLELFFDHCKLLKKKFNMTMQYAELATSRSTEDSHYNYFRTGPEGLAWDCLQIIGLAKGKITLNNDSPIWDCKINGQTLDLAAMDGAYLSFVKKWLSGRLFQNYDDLYNMHLKTSEIANGVI